MIASMRLPVVIDGSSRKVSWGVYFKRTWRPSVARRCGAAASSAACVDACCSGSSSGTTPVPRFFARPSAE